MRLRSYIAVFSLMVIAGFLAVATAAFGSPAWRDSLPVWKGSRPVWAGSPPAWTGSPPVWSQSPARVVKSSYEGAYGDWFEYDEPSDTYSGTYFDVSRYNVNFASEGSFKDTFLWGSTWSWSPGSGWDEDWWFAEQIPDKDFSIDKKLSRASLNTSTSRGDIQANWSGYGETWDYSWHDRRRQRGWQDKFRYKDSWRQASLEATIDGTDMGEADWAEMYTGRYSDVTK